MMPGRPTISAHRLPRSIQSVRACGRMPTRRATNDAAGRAFHRVTDRTVGCAGQTTAMHLEDGTTEVWSFGGAAPTAMPASALDELSAAELARVLTPGGALFFSVPVDPALFTRFDTACGHVRRYQADELRDRLAAHDLHIERWTTQRNNYKPRVGNLIGAFLQAIAGWPRLTLLLKRRAVAAEMRLRYTWRSDDIRASHPAGGLIAIARRR